MGETADRDCERPLVDLALRLARQAASAEFAGRDEYVDALVQFATSTKAGIRPPDVWQHHHLGHLITG